MPPDAGCRLFAPAAWVTGPAHPPIARSPTWAMDTRTAPGTIIAAPTCTARSRSSTTAPCVSPHPGRPGIPAGRAASGTETSRPAAPPTASPRTVTRRLPIRGSLRRPLDRRSDRSHHVIVEGLSILAPQCTTLRSRMMQDCVRRWQPTLRDLLRPATDQSQPGRAADHCTGRPMMTLT